MTVYLPDTNVLVDALNGKRERRELLRDLVLAGNRRAGRLRFDYARQGITLSLGDMLIAATALEHGLTLITQNQKHFPLPDLALHPLPGDPA